MGSRSRFRDIIHREDITNFARDEDGIDNHNAWGGSLGEVYLY